MDTDQNLSSLNFHWLCLTLSLLYEGERRCLWTIEKPPGREWDHGQLCLNISGQLTKVFVQRDPRTSLSKLGQANFVDLNNPSSLVIVYPSASVPHKRATSPSRSFPGSFPVNEPTEIFLHDLVDEATTIDGLIEAVQMEIQTTRSA